MPTREELISQCRYYKGEEGDPFEKDDRRGWFWHFEKMYVSDKGKFPGDLKYYTESLKGKIFPDVPLPLLLIMFTSWGKYVYDHAKSIGDFYKIIEEEYLQAPKNSDTPNPSKEARS